jgi:hypothetical protein
LVVADDQPVERPGGLPTLHPCATARFGSAVSERDHRSCEARDSDQDREEDRPRHKEDPQDHDAFDKGILAYASETRLRRIASRVPG